MTGSLKLIGVLLCAAAAAFIFSCGKDNSQKPVTETQRNEKSNEQSSSDEDADTVLTPQEAFSSSLVQDILGDEDDPDLEEYLEEEIYPVVLKSQKVTIDRISSSIFLLTYDEAGARKNFFIQKFYNPRKDEFVFEKTATDVEPMKQFIK